MPLGFFSSVNQQRAYLAPRLRRWWPSFRTGGDLYRQRLSELLVNDPVVLDIGCGDGGIIAEFKPRIGRLIGADLDTEAVRRNPYLDERLIADAAGIPLADSSVDLITGEFVLEHLAHPTRVLDELNRLVRPTGSLVFLTSNVRHPVMIASRFTPTVFHRWWKEHVLHKTEAVFPTIYRINTAPAVHTIAKAAGLYVADLAFAGNPEYGAIHALSATPSIWSERWLAAHQPTRQMYMIITLKKLP